MKNTLQSDFYTSHEVAAKIGVSVACILRYTRYSSDFPQPVRFSTRIVKWRKSEIDAFISGRTGAPVESGTCGASAVE